MGVGFLNVDLVVDSPENLTILADELADSVSIMFNGEWENGLNRLSISLSNSYGKDANEIISEFCSLIEKLSSQTKLSWDKAHSKKFDIGFESGSVGRLETEIRSETIERIAKFKASFLITIYPIKI
jgi:hypothetical protein